MPLSEQQEHALQWMRSREDDADASLACGGILADDVGAGKTRVVAELLRTNGSLSPTLIIVPKSLVYQWIMELHSSGVMDVSVVASRSAASGRDLSRASVVLASISCFGGENIPDFASRQLWGRLVVDEAHLAKNPRTRMHRGLVAVRAQARWMLTATPVQNCRADLIALAKLVGVKTNDDVAMIRDNFMLRRVSSQGQKSGGDDASAHVCSQLPPLSVRTVRLELVAKREREVCAAVHADAASSAAMDETAAATGSLSVSAMERVLRCRQVATHLALYYSSIAASCTDPDKAIEFAEKADEARADPAASTKVAWLVADVLAHPGERSVVFCDWRDEMRIVSQALSARGVRCIEFHGSMSIEERDAALESASRASSRRPIALIAQIRCASCGLNLQFASRAYLMRPQDNPAVELQAIGRLHRRGQTHPVSVMRLVAQGTIDENCMTRQRQKLGVINETLLDDSMRIRLHGTD